LKRGTVVLQGRGEGSGGGGGGGTKRQKGKTKNLEWRRGEVGPSPLGVSLAVANKRPLLSGCFALGTLLLLLLLLLLFPLKIGLSLVNDIESSEVSLTSFKPTKKEEWEEEEEEEGGTETVSCSLLIGFGGGFGF